MTAPMGRERTPGEIEEAIIDMALRGFSPTQIHRALPAVAKDLGLKVPSLRTVQRIAGRIRPKDSSEDWRITDSPADDARLVLDFVAQIIVGSEGRWSWVTRGQAEWVARLRRLAPQSSVPWTMRTMTTFRDRLDRGLSTEDLDAFLAFGPWRSRQMAAGYAEAVLRRHVPPGHLWYVWDFVPWVPLIGFGVVALQGPTDRSDDPPSGRVAIVEEGKTIECDDPQPYLDRLAELTREDSDGAKD